MDEQLLKKVKLLLRENDIPYFEDEEIVEYSKIYTEFNELMYNLLLIKAQDNTLTISGLTTNNDANYFKMLLQKYKKSNSGILKG